MSAMHCPSTARAANVSNFGFVILMKTRSICVIPLKYVNIQSMIAVHKKTLEVRLNNPGV